MNLHCHPEHRQTPCNGGFSLVEVALALLVVAIGLTAIIGLFPAGMQASRTAVEETEMGEFAEFVFETLEVIGNRDWADLSDAGLSKAIHRNIASTRIMGMAPTAEQLVAAAAPANPRLYYWQPANTEISTLVRNQIVTRFTYLLEIQPVPGTNNRLKHARLQVWPGMRDNAVRAGGGKDFPGSIVFYREFRSSI